MFVYHDAGQAVGMNSELSLTEKMEVIVKLGDFCHTRWHDSNHFFPFPPRDEERSLFDSRLVRSPM